ncbi:MAG: beta-hydroxyacyl-ACP dehydratase [Algicola sp.]|nr:beta-hydroxyacyl-ACP dehydratase [Algicola sp.]
MNSQEIIAQLPYQAPFLFVDELSEMSSDGITGTYKFHHDDYFYKGHFKNNPVTPGVILIECMAQIGLVSLGIYILKDTVANSKATKIAFTSAQVDFFLPVLPGDKVTVVSEKEVFRFHKLKCLVKMLNNEGDLICRGHLSGMISV